VTTGLREKLQASSEQKRAESLAKELKAVRRQLELTATELTRVRNARRVVLPKAPARPRLKGDRVRMILNDVHGAKMDRKAVAIALADVRKMQPHHIILNGDIVDCGGFLAQHHVLGYVAETSYSYAEDIAAANWFLDELRKAAPNAHIEYIEGNHERRVETWCVTEALRNPKDAELLRAVFSPSALLNLKQREISYFRTSECYDGLTVPGFIKRGKCYFTHGFTCAKAAAASTQSSVSGNVCYAHTHRHQADVVRRVSVGVIGAWNPGCLCHIQPLWQHGKPTDWTLGIALQFVSHTDSFLHLNIPIIDGQSYLVALLNNESSAEIIRSRKAA
jgi:hypothetical protein